MGEADTIWAAGAPALYFIGEICEKREVTSITRGGVGDATYQRGPEGETARRQRQQRISGESGSTATPPTMFLQTRSASNGSV